MYMFLKSNFIEITFTTLLELQIGEGQSLLSPTIITSILF